MAGGIFAFARISTTSSPATPAQRDIRVDTGAACDYGHINAWNTSPDPDMSFLFAYDRLQR